MKLIITEKPSVGREFAKALGVRGLKKGYFENDEWIVTWCLGHLVTLSYPDKYDPALKSWRLDSLPFLPKTYRYEVIKDKEPGSSPSGNPQYDVVEKLLNRRDVTEVYNAGDSGREGEYIQRLVYDMAGCKKPIKRVWINSQTKEEILRGIREAKPSSDYDDLASAAYERAIADYMVGINFTRAMSEKAKSYKPDKKPRAISIGRVRTCVLAMIAEREREIEAFVPTDYFRIEAQAGGMTCKWKAGKDSPYYGPFDLYKDNGLLDEKKADSLLALFRRSPSLRLVSIGTREEKKKAPSLYNLSELQGECSKKLKISPDMTLAIVQSLYEKKLVTYPRTDARVLSTAVAKEIGKNVDGLIEAYPMLAGQIRDQGWLRRAMQYVDDERITDHYAIIPTGHPASGLGPVESKVYDMIARRFLSIFFPPAIYSKTEIELEHEATGEKFFVSDKYLIDEGYLQAASGGHGPGTPSVDVRRFKKGDVLPASFDKVKSQTKPPARYTSGSMILAMENAGNLVEDEELRAQIKGSGIGTSATRAETISKLCRDGYVDLDKKTQVLTPTREGFLAHDLVGSVLPDLESPSATASWEKGLSMVEEGQESPERFRQHMERYVNDGVKRIKDMDPEEIRKIQSRYIKVSEPSRYKIEDVCQCRCGGTIRECDDGESKHFFICTNFKTGGKGKCLFVHSADDGFNVDTVRQLMEEGKADSPNGNGKTFMLGSKQAVGEISEGPGLLCPKCGEVLLRSGAKIKCSSCGFEAWGKSFGREISDDEFRILFRDSVAGPYDGFVGMGGANKGKPFTGYLLFDGSSVYVGEETFHGRQMLKREYIDLAEKGQTEELDGFVSKKGSRFAARLILKKGFISFDFD